MSYSDDSDRMTKSSIAAFMFMPQFNLCFRGFSHLWPVFMRCLGLVFAEAKLISQDHPSLRYGEQGIEKSSLRELFSSAWYTLRVTRSDTYQWGMFLGIVLMVGMATAALGTFFMRVFFGIGNAVYAQYYLPNVLDNPCNPYGGGACTMGANDTSIATAVTGITNPGAVLYDLRVQGTDTGATGISTDYALMVLDKILRQSMTAPFPGQNGGILQNALLELIRMYNTGLTLIAGIIALWMIVSIVVKTARAGVLGGGRTNMVWVPIRMVFALGIIFPLGAQGYSAGQYMVVKLAEWGSNLGSRGWVTYVTAVAGDATMLAPFSVNNATSLVSGINKIMICQVAHNAALFDQTGDLDQRQVIRVKQDNSPASDSVVNTYTNDTEGNLCGTVSYTIDKGGAAGGFGVDADEMLMSTNVITSMDPVHAAAAANPANRAVNKNFNNTLATAVSNFRRAMVNALNPGGNPLLGENLDDGPLPNYGRGVASGPVIMQARELACQIVGRYYETLNTGGPNPVFAMGTAPTGAAYNPCPAAMAAPIAIPNTTIPQRQVHAIMDAMMCAYDGSAPIGPNSPACATAAPGARGILMNYLTQPGGLINEISIRGWAGMGRWHLDIAGINSQVQGTAEPTATFEPGTMWDGGSKSGMMGGLKCPGQKQLNQPCDKPEIEEAVMGAMGEYDGWWANASVPGKAGDTPNGFDPTEFRNQSLGESAGSSAPGIWGIVWTLLRGGDLGKKITAYVLSKILPRTGDDIFWFGAIDLAATNTYPLAMLTKAGHSIMNTGLIVISGLTIIQVFWGGKIATISGGPGLAVSILTNMIQTISMAMIVAGIMVAFYLPIIPLLRVAMAVLTWMFSIFEAVVMLPIAAIAHLSAEGQGLAGGAKSVWILWLNVLMRPILVVFGFVGAMLIFNSFAAYFQTTFAEGARATLIANSSSLLYAFIGQAFYSVIYTGTLYTVANMCFKLLDILPQRMMRWMGGGVADRSLDDGSDGQMLAAANYMQNMKPDLSRPADRPKSGPDDKKPGAAQVKTTG